MVDRCLKIFIDESRKNLKTIELLNWVGKIYIGNRKHIDIIQQIAELVQSTGIYLLLGNDTQTNERFLYIGEADEIAQRIKQHSNDKRKEWFEEFIVFVSTDKNLTKAHVRYLEKSMYELSLENLTTIKLKNGNNPPGSNLSEYDIAYMKEFQSNIIFILNNLNIIDFVKTNTSTCVKNIDNNNLFYLNLTQDRIDKNGNIIKAKLNITDNGYILLKGSYVESIERAPSFKKHIYYKLRKKLEEDNLFIESDIKGLWKTKEDIPFNSCSAAAAVVKNRATNGRTEWKLDSGVTLDEYERK